MPSPAATSAPPRSARSHRYVNRPVMEKARITGSPNCIGAGIVPGLPGSLPAEDVADRRQAGRDLRQLIRTPAGGRCRDVAEDLAHALPGVRQLAQLLG